MLKRNFRISTSVVFAICFLACRNSNQSSYLSFNTASAKDPDVITASGAIAYTRNGTEIRTVDSNGNNDRQLWTDTSLSPSLGLYELAWRPDGKELAFSSAHEALFSLYHADLYAIRPDGSGLRKITNSPSRKDFGKYKKGMVSLTVRNNQYSFQKSNANAGVFFVTIAGAEDPQLITVPPGASKTVVFRSVADFGKKAQGIVAINGNFRWSMPGTDVEAGKTIKAPDLIITGNGIEYFGAFRPCWNQDGSKISYRDGVCLIKTIDAFPESGAFSYTPIFKDKNPLGTCTWAYGPTAALKDQVIYTENNTGEGSNIYMMKDGGSHKDAVKLAQFSELPYQLLHDLEWLPDGSGFFYSTVNLYRDASNIFKYDIRAKQTKQLTNLSGQFAREFCVSPSGKWIVYELAKTDNEDRDVDLWIMSTDGSGAKLLVKNGMSPSWGK